VVSGIREVQTGFSPRLDLSHAGTMQISPKVVMEVLVEDAQGRPKKNLGQEQRWRGLALETYRNGRWFHEVQNAAARRIGHGTRQDLPDLGDDRLYMTCTLEVGQAGGLFLAEPVVLLPPRRSPPLVSHTEGKWLPFYHRRDMTLLRDAATAPKPYIYEQVTRSLAPGEIMPALDMFKDYRQRLLQKPPENIRVWSRDLLQRLIDEKKLAPADLTMQPDLASPTGECLAAEHRAKVAETLSNYLAQSGEYTYTLDLQRSDRTIDPTEDFLFHVKQGACEHFAGALVLMMRSAGIPSRVVNGYRGADNRGDGSYIIRESNAHAWTEALVELQGSDGVRRQTWKTLDPSPVEAVQASGLSTTWAAWWEYQKSIVRAYWRAFVLESNTEPIYDWDSPIWAHLGLTARAANSAKGLASVPVLLYAVIGLALVLVIAIALGIRLGIRKARTRRRPQHLRAGVLIPFYARWLDLVARYWRLRPLPSHTAGEFGVQVHEYMQRQAALAAFTDLPGRIARLYYRVRYGNQRLTLVEVTSLEQQMSDLTGLAGATHPGQ
jgi:hypothetical protein